VPYDESEQSGGSEGSNEEIITFRVPDRRLISMLGMNHQPIAHLLSPSSPI
jgi:hypothetical protein